MVQKGCPSGLGEGSDFNMYEVFGRDNSQALRDLATYTKAFDAQYGTHIYQALVKNGFPIR